MLERGTLGTLPYAALGTGPPLVVLAGLSPTAGAQSDGMVKASLGPLAAVARSRRVIVLNRRTGLPRGMTMAELAAEHAAALPEPVDVVGISTGGSIAQQLAADRPQAVRRLVLISTACRLGAEGRELQRRVAARIRAGARGEALAVMAAGLVPRGKAAAGLAGRLLGPRLIGDDLADLATTIEAEDGFDLAACRPIRAPTLILAGAEDRFYSRALFEETARLIADSTLRRFAGRGHITVMSDPGARAELSGFLELGSP